MKLSKRFIAGAMTVLMMATSMPAIQPQAASLKYENTYIKSIKIVKPVAKKVADTSSSSSNSASSSSGASNASQSSSSGASSADGNTSNSAASGTTGDASAASSASSNAANSGSTGAANSASTASTVKEKIVYEPEVQEETVKVMKGMRFALSITRYGKLIKKYKDNNKYFTFKTSNKKVATVTKNGVITTLKNGKCDITVINKKDDVKYTVHLLVTKNIKIKSIKLNTTSKKYKKPGKKFSLKAKIKVLTKKAGNIPIAWYSTDTDVATVDSFGNVTVEDYGECEICCTAGSNKKVAKCKLKVIDPKAKKKQSEDDNGDNGYSGGRPEYNTGKVVDLSRFNTVYDWGRLRESCDAVILRVGYRGYGAEGNIVEDSSFSSNAYYCRQYGIPYSVYFVTTATSYEEGAAEANYIASKVGDQSLCFPAFMDTEKTGGYPGGRSDGLSPSARTNAIKGACQQLNARGIGGGIYASTYWIQDNLIMSELPYSMWVADYRGYCGYGGDKLLWQYTSNGSGYGVRTGGSDRCDVSYWYD